jgi:aldehyde:ferredoxin oxidoreductase
MLRVDLGGGITRTPAMGEPGIGGVRLLLDETPAGLDPFEPAAPIVFAVGASSGRRVLALPGCTVVAKSPLSGGIGESRVTGPFGPALADTGHDALVLTGRAERPVYILVTPDETRVLDATPVWGAGTRETTAWLMDRHPGAHVAAIGPAGERLVRFASVVTDLGFAAARMGLGAVLGAKRCKAIVVAGGSAPPVADPAAVARVTGDYLAELTVNPLTRTEFEPPGFGAWPAEGQEGYLGAANYRTSRVRLPGFGAAAFTARLHRSSGGCPGCPQDCLKSFAADDSGTLHQEAVAVFAAQLGVADLDQVLEWNRWCHDVGVDPVSLGGVLAFRCELASEGLVAGPRFGDAAALRALAGDIVSRTADGDVLAEGVARAAAVLGPATEPYAMHSKGIELPPFDPRGSHGLALAYAVHPLGPRYDGVEHDIDFDPVDGTDRFIANAGASFPMAMLNESKVDFVAGLLELWSGYDAAGLCLYAAPPTRNLTEESAASLLAAVTGRPVTPATVRRWGRTRLALMREYNVREGIPAAADTVPDRFFELPVDGGRLAGAVLDRAGFAAAVGRLRSLLGWV